VPLARETQGGEDVAACALEPGAAAAVGLMERNRLRGPFFEALFGRPLKD